MFKKNKSYFIPTEDIYSKYDFLECAKRFGHTKPYGYFFDIINGGIEEPKRFAILDHITSEDRPYIYKDHNNELWGCRYFVALEDIHIVNLDECCNTKYITDDFLPLKI